MKLDSFWFVKLARARAGGFPVTDASIAEAMYLSLVEAGSGPQFAMDVAEAWKANDERRFNAAFEKANAKVATFQYEKVVYGYIAA